MKNTFVVTLALILFSCANPGQDGTLLEITIENPQDEWIYVEKLSDLGLEKIDSIKAVDGKGSFTINSVSDDFYRLNVYGRKSVNFILTGKEDKVEVFTNASPDGKSRISGSYDTNLIVGFDSLARKRQGDIQLLNQEAIQARSQGDLKTLNDITAQYHYLNGKHNTNLKDMIWDAIPSLAALYAINYIDVEAEFGFADSVSQVFERELPDHMMSRDLAERIRGLKSLSIGAPAPEISLPAPDGETITLSSLRGKYVLIDFWAAWCRPCRMENQNVVKLYEQYRNENFEIYGVSLDRKRDAWLKAIEDDGLEWLHVSDLQYFNSAGARSYRINAIPATYLIDPDGNILAKGLRGESLKAKLKEIFG